MTEPLYDKDSLPPFKYRMVLKFDGFERVVEGEYPSKSVPELQPLPFPWSEYDAVELTDLMQAIGNLSMALGNPAMCAGLGTTIEAQLLRYAADRHKEQADELAKFRDKAVSTRQFTVETFDGEEPAILVSARWVIEHAGKIKDYACAQCVPNGDALIPGLQCNYHRAESALSASGRREG